MNSLTKLEVLEEENNDMIKEVISESNTMAQIETQKTELGEQRRLDSLKDYFSNVPIEILGQGKNLKLRVSSYFHIYGYWVILGHVR